MSNLTVGDQQIALDKDGFLADLQAWSPEVAQALAARENIALTPEHWEVLEVLRQFYDEFQLSPATRPLIKYTALKLGPEKATVRTSIVCSTALPPNSLPSWRACPSQPTAYDHRSSTHFANPGRTSLR